MAIILVSDSGSDLITNEKIQIVPLTVELEGKKYRDGVDLSKEYFYEKLPTLTEFPKTAQPAPNDYLEIFEKAKANNDEVICLTLSAGLSGTYNSANLAKNIVSYDKIYIVDSIEATAGLRLLIDYAIKQIEMNKPALQIVDELEELKHKIILFVMVDTLEYLWKGGRVSKTTASVGNFLSLKPIIRVRHGKLETVGKGIGRQRAIKTIMGYVEEEPIDFNYPVYFLYTKDSSNSEKLISKMNAKYEGIDKSMNCEMGPTIGSHIGPYSLGIVYVGFKKQ